MAATRKTILKPVREEVWRKRNGTSTEGRCFVCSQPLSLSLMECGHIVAVANGGSNSASNLEPICAGCNRSMGKRNLNEYKKMITAQEQTPMDIDEKTRAVRIVELEAQVSTLTQQNKWLLERALEYEKMCKAKLAEIQRYVESLKKA